MQPIEISFSPPMVSLSADIDPRKFKWFSYQGRPLEVRLSNGLILELKKNNVFALKKGRTKWTYTDAASLDLKVTLDAYDAERLLNNSKGWSGKVGRYKVEAGEGGRDVKLITPPDVSDTLITIPADSSTLYRIFYKPAKKILFIEFRSGDRWQYEKVTQKEVDELTKAPSQGSYFYYRIRKVKPQKKVKDFK